MHSVRFIRPVPAAKGFRWRYLATRRSNCGRTRLAPLPGLGLGILLAVCCQGRLTMAAVPPPSTALGQDSQVTAEEAGRRYLSNKQQLFEAKLVPSLERGMLSISTARPPTLSVWVTEDLSPYHISAKFGANGALIVRLSLGYLTMHDAALDAVAIAGPSKNSKALRSYLRYQLELARSNDRRTAANEPRDRAKSFAEFARLEPKSVQALFDQPQWRAERDRAEMDSLGWTIAFLLVGLDSRNAGVPAAVPQSTAAARLAAASGFFPAPPFATAFQMADIIRPRGEKPDERVQVCRAADFMAAGGSAVAASREWQERLSQNAKLRDQVIRLDSEVKRMRRDGRCEKAENTSV